jgi:hypothetical protein
MKNSYNVFLLVFVFLISSCTSEKQKSYLKSEDENMHQFIERIANELSTETSYEVVEWTDWKVDNNKTANLIIVKNYASKLLEFKVLIQNEDGSYNVNLIYPLRTSEYLNFKDVTWTFPHYEAVDFNNDNIAEFVVLAEAAGIIENDNGITPVDEKMIVCFSFQDDIFTEAQGYQEEIMQLPAINMLLNQPKLSMAGQGTLNSTEDILAFLQEIKFIHNELENESLVSILKQDEIFAFDKCFSDGIKRAFMNESKISDPAYLPVFVESGNETSEYTIQSIEEMSENEYELSIIAVKDLENQIFNTQIEVNIFWNGVWILEKNDFYYTTKRKASKLKQIERDCPEV